MESFSSFDGGEKEVKPVTLPQGVRKSTEAALEQLPLVSGVQTRLTRPGQPSPHAPLGDQCHFGQGASTDSRAGGGTIHGRSVPVGVPGNFGTSPACLPGLPAPRWCRGGTMSGLGPDPPPPSATAAASDSQNCRGA